MPKRKNQDENDNKENTVKKTKNVRNSASKDVVLVEINKNVQIDTNTAVNPKKEEAIPSETLKPVKSGEKLSHGVCEKLPLCPELDINEFEVMKFPLKVAQTERLIRHIKKKNEKTKDVFELDSSQLKLKHGEWENNFESLLDKIGVELGFRGKANCNLERLEVFKEGSKSRKHKYSCEKDATLLVQLPSYFNGGELVVYNEKNKPQSNEPENIITFGQSDNKAASSIQYLAYKNELEYEMMEITSGYRIFLVYSLSFSNE
jgi:hypothetical protein